MSDEPLRENKGFHPLLERDRPFTFVDACLQAWPDADFANAHRHGVNAFAVTSFRPRAELQDAFEGLMFWHAIARQHANIVVATSAAGIREARAQGRLALVLAPQGGDFVGRALHRVEAFHRLGLRMMLFAYNSTNSLCDGALDTTDSGLTRFGQAVTRECNRLGLLVDCTHIGERASPQVIDESGDHVTFSHSNASALAAAPATSATSRSWPACGGAA
jgi:membrane dipeptidase